MSAEEDDDPIETVEEQAADWIVRQDDGDLSEEDRGVFEAWLDEPAHRAAYERHHAVWMAYRKAGPSMALHPDRGDLARRRAAGRRWPAARIPRSMVFPALAASLALAVIGYAEHWPMRLRADHMTGVGERRSVTLADGSTVRLDARSAISFDQSEGRRVVYLLEGAAAFQVASDRAHPFTVVTTAGSVTALGTAFAVRDGKDAAELVVTQHSVEVLTGQGERAVVREGEGATFTHDRVAPPHAMDVAAATAWTRGKLFVFNRPLEEVVARIAQERRVYWTVRGDAASMRVNGVFDLNDPQHAIEVLQRTLELHALRFSDRFIILSR
jgi:transmembrane sensor